MPRMKALHHPLLCWIMALALGLALPGVAMAHKPAMAKHYAALTAFFAMGGEISDICGGHNTPSQPRCEACRLADAADLAPNTTLLLAPWSKRSAAGTPAVGLPPRGMHPVGWNGRAPPV